MTLNVEKKNNSRRIEENQLSQQRVPISHMNVINRLIVDGNGIALSQFAFI